MLKKHKKFDLNRERKQQNFIELYAARNCKYCKYFIAPALISFFLLCILLNVDFTSEVNNFESDIDTQGNLTLLKSENAILTSVTLESDLATLNSNTAKKMAADKLIETARGVQEITNWAEYKSEDDNVKGKATIRSQTEEDVNGSEIKNQNVSENMASTDLKGRSAKQLDIFTEIYHFKTAAISCQEYKDNCTLYCSDGSVSYIDENLEQFQSKCQNKFLNLILTKCEFTFGTLQQSFFYGDFSLGYLSINECNLNTIKDAAFKHNNVKNLHTLILTNNQLTSLQDTTFDGLSNLLNFKFVQAPLSSSFEGEAFLKPLVNNLEEATIQPRINDSEIIDPLNWWQQLQMNSLTVLDISNTNLQGILNSKTFEPFVALEYLMLSNCNLLSIKAEVFNFMSISFQYMDLRFNHLQTLDYNFLQKLVIPNIEINLSSNQWYCECNTEMLQYFKDHDVYLSEEILCSAPKKWQLMELSRVIEECEDGEISTLSALSTTTILSIVTDEISTSTTTMRYTHEPTGTILFTTTNESSTKDFDPSGNTTQDSTAASEDYVTITCYMNKEKLVSYLQTVVTSTANFSLHINSSTSLTVKVQRAKLQTFSIVYFMNHDNYSIMDYPETMDTQTESMAEKFIFIRDLKPSETYMFCLIMENAETMSPFDCQGQFMEVKQSAKIWLLQSDKVWFIALNFTMAVFVVFLTMFIVYIILRYNPRWLSKRNRSQKYLLVTRKFSNSSHCLEPSHKSANYLSYLPPLQHLSNNDTVNRMYTSQHVVPILTAPNSPPAYECNSSRSPAKRCWPAVKEFPQNIDYLDVIGNDPYYQTIDLYESLHE